MKLTAEINNESRQIEVRREGDKVFATVDEKNYELEAHATAPDTYLFKLNGKVYECYVSPAPVGGKSQVTVGGKSQVTVGANSYEFTLADPKRLSHAGGPHAHGAGAAEIVTQMPGKVVRILVGVGDEVKEKDAVIVVEAMKMQNEMKAPKDGTVKSVNFTEGDTVNAGDVLMVIE
jgi:biotin carboxyl carrier protein